MTRYTCSCAFLWVLGQKIDEIPVYAKTTKQTLLLPRKYMWRVVILLWLQWYLYYSCTDHCSMTKLCMYVFLSHPACVCRGSLSTSTATTYPAGGRKTVTPQSHPWLPALLPWSPYTHHHTCKWPTVIIQMVTIEQDFQKKIGNRFLNHIQCVGEIKRIVHSPFLYDRHTRHQYQITRASERRQHHRREMWRELWHAS